jgi:hypothetical protein
MRLNERQRLLQPLELGARPTSHVFDEVDHARAPPSWTLDSEDEVTAMDLTLACFPCRHDASPPDTNGAGLRKSQIN